VATNSMAGATCFRLAPEQLHVTHGPHSSADQLSLIIPDAAMHGPPTSSTVLVNLGTSIEPAAHGFPLRTELEARLVPAMSAAFCN